MPTHQSGGLLDVVITRSDLPSLDVQVVDVGLSDHHMLQWSVSTARSPPVVETIVRRPWRSLDVDDFRSALSTSVLCQPDHWRELDADELSTLYESELTAILDSLIPARVMTRRPRPSDPWFDADCRAAKRTTRRLERAAIAAAKKSDANAAVLAADAWRNQRRSYRELRNRKREEFWSNTVAANRSSPRQLWRSVDILLGRGRVPASAAVSVDDFNRFFAEKVNAVRAATIGCQPPVYTPA
ncbi:MAG TPA: hypothetical protein VLS45_02605, partial [Methylomicrobium sp.]|nr:hypothetical protein [Methylomicrobium sp.]